MSNPFSSINPSSTPRSKASIISDPAIEAKLHIALNKYEGPIYKDDLNSITSLELEAGNISDISALSGFTNLNNGIFNKGEATR